MEGKDDHGPATSQLTPLQVDLLNSPKDKRNTLTGKNVPGSEKLSTQFKSISDYWLAPNPKALHILVEVPLGKRWVQWVSEILLTLSRLTSTAAIRRGSHFIFHPSIIAFSSP